MILEFGRTELKLISDLLLMIDPTASNSSKPPVIGPPVSCSVTDRPEKNLRDVE